jgi:hypothetical protein
VSEPRLRVGQMAMCTGLHSPTQITSPLFEDVVSCSLESACVHVHAHTQLRYICGIAVLVESDRITSKADVLLQSA